MSLFDVYSLLDVTPLKGKGVLVYDEKGQEYLDLYGGHAVISIGHSEPKFVEAISKQLSQLAFYSNAVINPLQQELAKKICMISSCNDYQLFLCNSGAEANENALKLASFQTGKKGILAFKNSFHGRTSAAVAATDNPNIVAPINAIHQVEFVNLGDIDAVEAVLQKGETAAVIIECIQGVGGVNEAEPKFYMQLAEKCKHYGAKLIADEVQSGYGRTGKFFAFQHYGIAPDLISIAKGMGNGFPIGGVLIHPDVKARHGMLGTTFGGNHLACAAGIAVLDVIVEDQLIVNVNSLSTYFKEQASKIPQIKQIKGKGLMLGLEFGVEVVTVRKQLLYNHKIFTGSSSNPKLLRLLPPLCLNETHVDQFFDALKAVLNEAK